MTCTVGYCMGPMIPSRVKCYFSLGISKCFHLLKATGVLSDGVFSPFTLLTSTLITTVTCSPSLLMALSSFTKSSTSPSETYGRTVGKKLNAILTLIPLGGGGGGLFQPPPCRFFRRASRPIGISRSNFMTFFSQVSRIFWYIIHTGRTCRTDFRGRWLLDRHKNCNFCTGFYVIHISNAM